jgi:hypothetical protein
MPGALDRKHAAGALIERHAGVRGVSQFHRRGKTSAFGAIAVTRLVRIQAEPDAVPAGLASLAGGDLIDLVQLDYLRPRITAVHEAASVELAEYPASIADTVAGLGKLLFLEPELRVIAAAGWSNSYACVERVARALVACGCPEAPVSAVRGSNLLPILDYLQADGVRLDNSDTKAPWRTVPQPVLAADLLLGAGPLATALAEGGRVIVAGYYDGAAPAMAAAARKFGWEWTELDRLAGAAGAARASIWPHLHAGDWPAAMGQLTTVTGRPRVELDKDGQFTVDLSHPCESNDAERLLHWLQAGKAAGPAHLHADVQFVASRAAVAATGPTQLRVTGCTGKKTDGSWRLEVLYLAGYLAETMVEFVPGASNNLRGQIAEAFHAHFVDDADERSLVTVEELTPTGGATGAASWLHLACRSKTQQICRQFVDHVSRFVAANPTLVRLPAGRPDVRIECGLWPTRVPRDAIDIAVDTRPAKEWG